MNDFARPPRVLVVEDDDEIALALQRSLRMEGYDVRLAGDGVDALDQAHAFLPDVVLLDLGLPKLDGIEVAKELRKREDDVGILMLTARDGLDDRVAGLDTGADDYLVKPFERQELLARMRSLMRRRPPRGSAYLVVGDLRLNPDTHEVLRGGRRLDLTTREFELLVHLMRNERLWVSRQALLDEVCGYHPFAEANTVDAFVAVRRAVVVGGAAAGGAEYRVSGRDGVAVATTHHAPVLGPPVDGVRNVPGYRVVSRPLFAGVLTRQGPFEVLPPSPVDGAVAFI